MVLCGVVWCGGVVESVRGLGCGVVWCCGVENGVKC